jgi:Flp pilus assembly protein TadB
MRLSKKTVDMGTSSHKEANEILKQKLEKEHEKKDNTTTPSREDKHGISVEKDNAGEKSETTKERISASKTASIKQYALYTLLCISVTLLLALGAMKMFSPIISGILVIVGMLVTFVFSP